MEPDAGMSNAAVSGAGSEEAKEAAQVQVGRNADGEPQDRRDAVRRHRGLRHHVPAGVPHGPPSRSILHHHLLPLLRQQRREPRHLLIHEPGAFTRARVLVCVVYRL